MKKTLATIALCMSLMGCTNAHLSLFNRGQEKPNQAVVESFLRMNDEQGARDYLIRFQIPETKVIELLQLAREKKTK